MGGPPATAMPTSPPRCRARTCEVGGDAVDPCQAPDCARRLRAATVVPDTTMLTSGSDSKSTREVPTLKTLSSSISSDDLKASLERMAAATGRSEADLIRDAISTMTGGDGLVLPRLPLFDSGDPIANRSEELLAEGFGLD